MEDNGRQAQASDEHLISEIESLRAILLAKAGDLKSELAEKVKEEQIRVNSL